MKTKFLLLTAILTFGFSFGMNYLDKSEINENQKVSIENSIESLDVDIPFTSFDINAAKELMFIDCGEFAVAVFDAAIEQGYSIDDAYDAGIAAGAACVALQKIGQYL